MALEGYGLFVGILLQKLRIIYASGKATKNKTMKFVDKLKELCDREGLDEVKLAEAAGFRLATIRSYQLGKRKPSFEAVVKLARALGTSCEAFADCDDVASKTRTQPPKAMPSTPPAAALEAVPKGKQKKLGLVEGTHQNKRPIKYGVSKRPSAPRFGTDKKIFVMCLSMTKARP